MAYLTATISSHAAAKVPDGVHEDMVMPTFLPILLLLFACSIVGLGMDIVLRCRQGGMVIQLTVQALVMVLPSNIFLGTDTALPLQPVHGVQENTANMAMEVPHVEVPHVESAAGTAGSEKSLPTRLRGGAGSMESAEEPDTMSVVLPCLNESKFAINTAKRFCERTPPGVLQEIIVVDDGSKPPLKELFAQSGFPERCNLRVLRHEKPYGLMVAKQTGGDAAAGKYIGFYDCHVSPAGDWYKETIKKLQQKKERLVVPMIGDIDLDTWDQRQNSAWTAKCYITFGADFWWYEDESDYIPVISGGLVATSRYWWRLSGGFDRGMRGWGGENTDQSLRTWLCGGDIVRDKTSKIAHMWRVPQDQRTLARYHFQGQTDNLARVAAIWFGEFKVKFRDGNVGHHNVDEALAKSKAMGCNHFVYFLHRFRRIYVDSGMIPEKVFKIKTLSPGGPRGGLCIGRKGTMYGMKSCEHADTDFHLSNWRPTGFPLPNQSLEGESSGGQHKQVTCGGHKANSCAECPQGKGSSWCHMDCTWHFGTCVSHGMKAKLVKTSDTPRCCSGLREWNAMECLDRLDPNGPIAYNCDVSGWNANQQYFFDNGLIRHSSGKCLSVKDVYSLVAENCEKATRWEKIQEFIPDETKLYNELVIRYGLRGDTPDH